MGRAHEVRASSMAKTAAMKSAKYSKWGKEIFEAAKRGVPDPEMNQDLKHAIEKAKKAQCPANVIKRAIEKADGIKSGAMIETVYEGFGQGNAGVIVEAATDNVNRTFASVRQIFNKTGGNLGSVGCASYMFTRKGILEFSGLTEDEAGEILMMADLDFEDISTDKDLVTIITSQEDYEGAKAALDAACPEIEYETSETKLISSLYVDLDPEQSEKFQRMLDLLEDDDDVQTVHHNANGFDD